jgi:hypothetical protein
VTLSRKVKTMGYLDNSTGILGVMPPASHERRRVEVGPADDRVAFLLDGRDRNATENTLAALV